jgi:hypothetical protein
LTAGNLLVVYALRQYPVRETVRDHLYSLGRYSRHRCSYLNLALRGLPSQSTLSRFQAVVFHNSFLSYRWDPGAFRDLLERAAPLRRVGEPRVAIAQDEFLRSDLLCEFIEDFGIDHVFTAAQPSEWPKIYADVDRSRVGFTTVLTGYLEPRSVERMARIAASVPRREIDLCYRAWHAAPWLGRHGQLKTRVAEAVREAAPRRGLRVDISTRDEDTLYSEGWYRLLASSRFTIGVEGGASLLDRDGSIKAATERYLAEHPGATFEQVRAACFPGRDGELSLFAISPRHLEACATRTCQVLVEGEYNGVLRAGEHYIPLRPDLGNLDEVLDSLADEGNRQRIAEAAYRDVVASGRYDYAHFVGQVEAALPSKVPPGAGPARASRALVAARDRLSWLELWWRLGVVARANVRLAALAKRVLPDRVVERLRR